MKSKIKSNIKAKKSQISIVLMLAVIIIFLAAFFIYVSFSSSKSRAVLKAEVAKLSPSYTKPLKEYIEACLDKTVSRGIRNLGEHTGIIDKKDGGVFDFSDFSSAYIIHNGEEVFYGMLAEECAGDKKSCGFSKLQGLDEKSGLAGTTIKENLESYIKNKIEECTNFGKASDPFMQQGFKITRDPNPSRGEIKASVVFLQDKVSTQLSMPLKVVNEASGETISIGSFSRDTSSRIKEIHDYANYILSKDIEDSEYDLLIDSSINPHPVNMISAVARKSDGDDMIEIKDAYYPTSYSFRFARQNRIPVIESISADKLNVEGRDPANDPVEDKNKITFTIVAKDYDEDELILFVNGMELSNYMLKKIENSKRGVYIFSYEYVASEDVKKEEKITFSFSVNDIHEKGSVISPLTASIITIKPKPIVP